MEENVVRISVHGGTLKEAEIWTGELTGFIIGADPAIRVQREKTNPDSQDLGSVLTIVFSSTAGAAVAHGVSVWLSRRQSAKISIKKDKVTAENLTSSDAVRIMQIISNQDNELS
jgi:hypothetical protein